MTEHVHHYSAEAGRRGVLRCAIATPFYASAVWGARILVWNFFRREMLGRFRGSFLGIFWVLLQPVFQFIIYFAVFGYLFSRGGPGMSSKEFAFYLFAGIVFFSSMVEGSSNGMRCILSNSNLVKKVAFPCEILPLTPVLVSTVVYLVGTLVLCIVGLSFGVVHLSASTFALPVLIVLHLAFTTGLSMLLAAITVFARDTAYLYTIFTQAWFFMSPNFWDFTLMQGVAEKHGLPWLTTLVMCNPTFPLLMAQRQIFGIDTNVPADRYQDYFPTTLGENLAMGGGWALLSLLLGYGFFMSRKRKFADLV